MTLIINPQHGDQNLIHADQELVIPEIYGCEKHKKKSP
jgi:hypothetical protein